MGKRAGFWVRVAATGIDLVVESFLLLGCVALYAAVLHLTQDDGTAETVLSIAAYTAVLLYTSCEIWFAGTLGKMALGLRIRRQDGEPADRWRLFLRWQTRHYPVICSLLFAASGLRVFYAMAGLMNLFIVIGLLFAMNDDKLTWHDEWAGTAVYWKRSLSPFGSAAPPPPLPAMA